MYLSTTFKTMKKYILLFFVSFPFCWGVFGQSISTDKNAITHSRLRVATTNEADANDPTKAVVTISYADGLGRGLQSVGYQQSPTQKDIITGAITYDEYGRPSVSILPAPATSGIGAYQSNAIGLGQSFYGDTRPYSSITAFDNSPLNRERETIGAGQAWATNNKKTQVFDEIAGTDIRLYKLDGSNNIILSGTYPAHSLYKKRIIDEQGYTSITIQDKQGRLIQKQQQDVNGYITTYYIYDGLGRVLAIIQPEGYELNTSINYNSTEWQRWVFTYTYDARGRVIEKHIPAAGIEYMVYDKTDRQVLSQDAHQRISNKWSFTKYDQYGRVIINGELTNNNNRSQLQTLFNGVTTPYEIWNNGYTNQSFPISYGSTDEKFWNFYDNYSWIAGEWAFNGAVAYNADNYSSNAKGLQTGAFARSNEDNSKVFHTVMHYDKKGRVMQTYQVHHKGGVNAFQKPIVTNYEYNFAGEVTKEKVLYQIDGLPNTEAITSHEYDHVGRILKVFHGINTTPTEIVKMDYDEVGRLLQKKVLPNGAYVVGGVKDYINRPNPDGIVTQNNTQDVARKAIVLEPTNSIDAINLTTYSAQIYSDAPSGTPISGLQTMNYAHHIRGGLLGINLDNSGNATPKASEGDLFSYKIEYETAGFYDGNIGKQSWQTTDNQNIPLGVRAYTYAYDASSRLKTASFSGLNGENYSLPNLSYDKNGNIQNLQRKGKNGSTYGDIDNLSYTYAGNKLLSVTDGISGNHEVDFVPRGGGAYTYYPNGALQSDENEQITNIIYDTFLKQPIEVVLSDGRNIKYFYDGAGRLFKTVYYSDATTVLETWDFIGGIILKNGLFYQMATPEGRAIYSGGAWQYEFDYKDHLGNTRVSFKANGNNLEKNSETAFDPYGVRLPIGANNAFQNRYEMQGHEAEKTFGLNRINFGNRTVNPTIGRFDRVDRFSEKYVSLSTFQYAANNPIRFIDVNGDSTFRFDEIGVFLGLFDTDEIGIRGAIGSERHTFNSDGEITGTVFTPKANFDFNDPTYDVQQLESLQIGEKAIDFLSDEKIDGIMKKSEIKEMSMIERFIFAKNESALGKMDFGLKYLSDGTYDGNGGRYGIQKTEPKGFFIIGGNRAYNVLDAGNFLWGNAMNRLGFDYSTALFGSQYNEDFQDAKGDQQAIKTGYHYKTKKQKR